MYSMVIIVNNTTVNKGFPCGSAGKESACNVGDLGSTPGEGKGYPLQYSGEFLGQYSPWSRKESDTTERLSLTHLIHQNLLPLMLFLLSKTRNNKPTHSSMIFQNFEVFFLEGISFVVMSCLVPM